MNAQYWAEVPSVKTVENLGPNTADSSKAEERTSTDHLEGCYYGWPHRAEPAGPSGCVVVSPSAMMWQSPGVFCFFPEATVETGLSQSL